MLSGSCASCKHPMDDHRYNPLPDQPACTIGYTFADWRNKIQPCKCPEYKDAP